MPKHKHDAEQRRLREDRREPDHIPGGAGGRIFSERQWGTVREDYSADGTALGRTSRMTTRAAARIAGGRTALPASATIVSCCALALAFWNGRDPILKERLFGLTNARGESRGGRQGILLLPGCRARRMPT